MKKHLASQDIFSILKKRTKPEHLRRRLERQMEHTAFQFSESRFKFHIENLQAPFLIFKGLLKCLGLWKKGLSNAMDYRLNAVKVAIRRLPESFNGFKILHLSDIHSDGLVDNGDRLLKLIKGVEFDLCVITGDFRFLTFDDYEPSLIKTKDLLDGLNCPYGTFGILGNHDFIEMVPALESFGIKMLLNESVRILKEREEIWLAGVDDCHFYEVHNLNNAFKDIPPNAPKIFLAHSPELLKEALSHHADYYLCGHTHGGQVCLPYSIALLTNAACPRKYCRGAWTYGKMQGYTSAGTGSSGLPIRFHCPPEIVIHELISCA